MKNSTARKLRQVPAGYLVVGVDPHKKTHAAVAMTQDFTTHSKFKFNNSKEGFKMALERIRLEIAKNGVYDGLRPCHCYPTGPNIACSLGLV